MTDDLSSGSDVDYRGRPGGPLEKWLSGSRSVCRYSWTRIEEYFTHVLMITEGCVQHVGSSN
jgi:hypothetical protein